MNPSSRLVLLALLAAAPGAFAQAVPAPPDMKVATWNIWHGGREDGDERGPARVVDVLADSGADLVALQETYGSGERIAAALGFHLHPRGTNVSILSRHPILEDLSVHEEFQCVGALIELPDASRVAFYSIWLPYSAEIWEAGTRDTERPKTMRAACEASAESLRAILAGIEARLAAPQYAGVPVVVAGDFNSMSHLDYGEVGERMFGAVVDWPTSHVLTRAGFVDSYRAAHPRIERLADSTWSPRFPEQEQDRIDFIYHRAPGWSVCASRVLRTHPEGFPSDHAAVLSTFRRAPAPTAGGDGLPLRAVSYNIKHGEGMDGRVDLARTAAVIAALEPDFLGLQEVDFHATRSGDVNQANELAGRLGMHPAFGAFMPFQGGRYGMAILSRHPLVRIESLRLPAGSEPRIALVVEARLPDGATILVVNVHFDWEDDDGPRFAQARALVEFLRGEERPYLLLGDFNDQPGSRTLALFDELAQGAAKPSTGRFTFPSDQPRKEIDFLFFSPPAAWRAERVEVIAEPRASDHRPLAVDLIWRGSAPR